MSVRVAVVIAAFVVVAAPPRITARAQGLDDPSFFRALAWRSLGPLQGGRATVAAGIPNQPNTFLIGTANGGVWKTTDAGRTWNSLFDDQTTGAIGAIGISPSNSGLIYVGTGALPIGDDAPAGSGLYRSSDGGGSWTHLGLDATEHIVRIALDGRDANRVFVAALGSPYRDDPQRGVFRSIDGGRSFERVLFTTDDAGATDVLVDPSDSRLVYAALWQFRRSAIDGTVASGRGSGLYKSTDGGTTWRRLGGLPTSTGPFRGRVTLATAGANGSRLLALGTAAMPGAGLYTSTDAGETWSAIAGTERLGLAEQARVHSVADASGRPVVYVTGQGVWRSTDLGASFQAWLAGPTLYEDLWVNPTAADIAIATGSYGAAVTVNGGGSWASVERQPLGRFAHVAIDTVFPFRVCGADAASGAGCLPLRGDAGRIRRQDWRVVGGTLAGFVVPDPIDPEIVYSGALARYDRRTSQAQEIAPAVGFSTSASSRPVLFAPTDSRSLLFADSVVWKSTTGGQTWTVISPSLPSEAPARPGNLAQYDEAQSSPASVRPSISALAPSYVDGRLLWAGTEDGLIHVTRDAGTSWRNVTPAETLAWARVVSLEASHFDANTVYAAIDRRRLGDRAPHLLRSRDGGATWTDVGAGLPRDAAALAIREDPLRRGLLFAGTSRSVFVSFDDGDRWLPLRLNLPPAGVRDFAIRESTLVAATDGRGFWALDDISALRQITVDIARADAFLFRPAAAWRPGRRSFAGVDDGAAVPAPEGVMLSYLIGQNVRDPVTIDIIETATGDVIRRFSSADAPATVDGRPGLHQVLWDLRYTPVQGRAPFVLPGAYQVRLIANGQPFRQAVLVRLDPIVRTPSADLALLLKHARAINAARAELVTALSQSPDPTRSPDLNAALEHLDRLFELVQQTDSRPTVAMETAISTAIERAAVLLSSRP